MLKKSKNRVIAGVCAGIAEALGWRPRQVRAIFVAVAFLGGASILAYLILWIAMPPADAVDRRKFDLENFRRQ